MPPGPIQVASVCAAAVSIIAAARGAVHRKRRIHEETIATHGQNAPAAGQLDAVMATDTEQRLGRPQRQPVASHHIVHLALHVTAGVLVTCCVAACIWRDSWDVGAAMLSAWILMLTAKVCSMPISSPVSQPTQHSQTAGIVLGGIHQWLQQG